MENNKKKIVAAVLVGLGALAYGVSPIDILPDLLGPIGLADDAVVIGAAVVAITKWVSAMRRTKPVEL